MQTIRVGGVPEHFNLAWHLAIENGSFEKQGIRIEWTDLPGGTGAMCEALRTNKLDLVIALTEGIIADIANGNPSRVIQFYVNSPLRWGIYVAADSAIHSMNETEGKKFAISRFNSGSHLMAKVQSSNSGIRLKDEDFICVGDLEGARKALAKDKELLFMWEKFTTKPLVDIGELRQIGECATPWPCFVIAATNEFIQKHPLALITLLNTINLECLLLKNNKNAPAMIADRYGIKPEDAATWFRELEYACQPDIMDLEMEEIFQKLVQYKIIGKIPLLSDICNSNNLIYTHPV
jgi:ABC-type nitrate/sulfonate/bicarbonate transport system substrate-binding protein